MIKFCLAVVFVFAMVVIGFSQDTLVAKNISKSALQQSDTNQILHHKPGFWERRIWQGDKKLNRNEVREIYKNDPEALKFYNTGKSLNTISYVLDGISISILGWQVGRMIYEKDPIKAFTIAGLGGLVTSLGLSIAGDICITKSVIVYDSNILKVYSYHFRLKISPTTNGIGLCLSF